MDPAIERLRAELRADREDLIRFSEVEVGALDREFERVSNRTDYRAATQLDVLKPKLARAYAELEAKQRRLAVKEERLEILVKVIPPVIQEESALRADVGTWKARPEVPPTDIARKLWGRSRALNIAKRVLFSVTGDMRFGKDYDAMDDLRFHWHQQEQQRARIFTHTLAPGFRPTAEPPTWSAEVARLRELSVVREEVSHAR